MPRLKPNEMPYAIEDLEPPTRQLLIDRAYNRTGLLQAIGDSVDADLCVHDEQVQFTKRNLAKLYLEWSNDERQLGRLLKDAGQVGLLDRVADRFGFGMQRDADGDPTQDEFRKQQLIYILITLSAGTEPNSIVSLPMQDGIGCSQGAAD